MPAAGRAVVGARGAGGFARPCAVSRAMHADLSRRGLLQGAAALAAAVATPWAGAQTFPNRPLKMISPLPAGGANDLAARVLAHAMQATVGQPVLVDNRAGGAFTVAVNALKIAPADGHTLLYVVSAMLATQALFAQYDMFRELVPVLGTGESDIVIAVSGKRPFRAVRELIDYGRSHPGKLNYASPGVGTLEHMALLNFCRRYGIQAAHVPVKGGPDMLKLLLAGHADFSTLALPLVLQFHADPRLRPLVVLNEKRNPLLPLVPTYVEEKLDIPRLTLWGGLAVLAGTPKDVVAALEKAAASASDSAEVKGRLSEAGLRPAVLPATAFGQLWHDDYGWIAKSAAALQSVITQ
ncbi:MAG: tripartite tricarboxylate transporter substrate binding protein [Proteobacteria bacterium]|nr:tripartite tricarboxylate transporter substrate binding protein [Pseudomonadota bacterium]